jgi:hypothetical protein
MNSRPERRMIIMNAAWKFLSFRMQILLFFMVFLVPCKVCAEEPITGVTYFDSIREDEEGGRLYYPTNVFWEPVKKEIYILTGGPRMLIYSADFFPLFTFDKKSGIESPSGLIVDADGNLYVPQSSSASNPRGRISVYNARLIRERDIYPEGFESRCIFPDTSRLIKKKFIGNRLSLGALYG